MIQNAISPKYLPELSHVERVNGHDVFVTTAGCCGVVYRLPVLDIESAKFGAELQAVRSIIAGISEKTVIRIRYQGSTKKHFSTSHCREQMLSEKGFFSETILIAFEQTVKEPSLLRTAFACISRWRKPSEVDKNDFLKKNLDCLVSDLPVSALADLGAVSLAGPELKALFDYGSSVIAKDAGGLDLGVGRLSAMRLWKPGSESINATTMARIKMELGSPAEIVVTIKKMSDKAAHWLLAKKAAQERSSNNHTSARKLEDSERALEDTFLGGESLCKIEWLCLLQRDTEELRNQDTKDALKSLSALGAVAHETSGVVSCLSAAQFGGEHHYPFIERINSAWAYLPICSYGEVEPCSTGSERRLVLHRDNGSIHVYDHFDRHYLGFTALINGKPGAGKSATANKISEAILQDDSVTMIKVDVGGSYRKECSLFGGELVEFSLDQPSGLNPFEIFGEVKRSKDAIMTITEFLFPLLKESSEQALPYGVVAELERKVAAYAESDRNARSIDDFLAFAPDIPRADLLGRWASGGLFENVLKSDPGKNRGATSAELEKLGRYRYYNLEGIHQAGNQDFAQGIMAAVIAQVNLAIIKAGDARSEKSRRLVLFVDECPFFMKKNGRFFKFTVQNFRKFGHGTLFIAQSLKDFEFVGDRGDIDLGIIQHSSIKFFFQVDGTDAEFKERFGLEDWHLERLRTLHKGRDYRDFLLQDDTGVRVCSLVMTPEEFWTVTSTRSDNEKLYNLKRAVPGLSDRQAIAVLAMTGGKLE